MKEVFAELYVCWDCGEVSCYRDPCPECGGEMEFTYFVPESRPTQRAVGRGLPSGLSQLRKAGQILADNGVKIVPPRR